MQANNVNISRELQNKVNAIVEAMKGKVNTEYQVAAFSERYMNIRQPEKGWFDVITIYFGMISDKEIAEGKLKSGTYKPLPLVRFCEQEKEQGYPAHIIWNADKAQSEQMEIDGDNWIEAFKSMPAPATPATPAAPAKKSICRRAVMVRAHEIARGLQGDRAACMSFALKQAWAEAKAA